MSGEPKPPVEYVCAAGCKRVEFVPADDINIPPGWVHLEITNRYRCGTCTRELAAAGREPSEKGL